MATLGNSEPFWVRVNYRLHLAVFSQVDMNSKNVFGQPRLRASLRDLRSPRRTYKSTIEDDLKKLIIMDNPAESPQRDPVRTTHSCTQLDQDVRYYAKCVSCKIASAHLSLPPRRHYVPFDSRPDT